MQQGTNIHKNLAWGHFGLGNVLGVWQSFLIIPRMTSRHDHGCAVFPSEFAVGPHGVDHELERFPLERKHRIIAVDDLRSFSRPDLDALRQVQLNFVTIWTQNTIYDLQ